MIKRVKFLAGTGYTNNLPNLKDREFTFEQGKVNVLFGPNGCGKSTLLKTMGAYSGVKLNAGWSQTLESLDFAKSAPGLAKAEVEWDGTPTFFFNAATLGDICNYFADNENDSMDGLSSMLDQIADIYISSGQRVQAKLAKLFTKTLLAPPDINNFENKGNYWLEKHQDILDYMMELPQDGPITVLIDEPDRSLELMAMITLWTRVLTKFANQYQLVIATHCPFVLMFDLPHVNLIDVQPGYIDECLAMLAFSGLKGTPALAGG